ncbi:MAG: prolipoprotein diacylglyceryl transferase [Hyphomicrobiaceae bacterium]|nr:prolipoprotein diacylglyceryl transferase [Hyphomicrobiaceae bacterium]
MSPLASVLAIPFPDLDPVALQVGPIAVKWYGLAYMAGLLLGWLYIRRLVRNPGLWPAGQPPLNIDRTDDLLFYITLGVVLGGRLGFVLFYEPAYYLSHPLEIVQVWRGGMAFHGALVGCGLAIWLFARRNAVSPWSAMDMCAAAVPIGLFFGRIANFINGELFGRPTSMPWGMVFPEAMYQYSAIEPTPRHPSQLYEAFFEGMVLFLVLRWMTHRRCALKSPGLTAGVFMIGYGLARSFCELFRQPDVLHGLTVGLLTPGIAYSVPMILLGLYFARSARMRVTA